MYFQLLRKMVAISAKEMRRDFLTLFFAFVFPLIFLVLFGFMSKSTGEPTPIRVAIIGSSQESLIASFIREFTANHAVSVREVDSAGGMAALESGSTGAVLTLTRSGSGLAVEIASQQKNNLYLHALVSQSLVAITEPTRAASIKNSITEKHIDANTNFGTTFLIPGLTAMALMQLALFGTANPIMMARARGTLIHFTLTPLPKSILIGSQVLNRLFVAALQIALMLGIAVFWLDIKLAQGAMSVLWIHGLGALMLISIGFLVAGLVPSQGAGGAIVMTLNFLMLGLGDVFFSTESMTGLDFVSSLVPLSYFTDASRQLIVGSPGRFPLSVDIGVMLTITVACFLLTVKTFNFGMKKA